MGRVQRRILSKFGYMPSYMAMSHLKMAKNPVKDFVTEAAAFKRLRVWLATTLNKMQPFQPITTF